MKSRIATILALAVLLPALLVGALPAHPAVAAENCQTFPETGMTVCDPFLSYWRANGGLAQQGYPISNPIPEISTVDNKPYVVQYFERAAFEYHPENAGTPYDVLLSLLGGERARVKYPNGIPTGYVPPSPQPSASASPAPNQPSPTPSPIPMQPSPPPAPPAGVVILKDDFSNLQSGWSVADYTRRYTRYENGAYRMYAYQGGTYITGYNAKLFNLRDTRVEGDVRSGGDGAFGVLCRYQNSQNFYILALTQTGEGAIVRYQNGVSTRLATTKGANAAVLRGGQTNHLRAECISNTLTLYSNNTLLATAHDSSFGTGDSMLYVEAVSLPTTVLFDNFIATKP